MKKFLFSIFLFFLNFSFIYAEVRVISIVANPIDGQKEKISIQNIGCENIDINGFVFQKIDTNKNKILDSKILGKYEILDIETSNFLKNSGDEFLFLNKQKEEIEKIFFNNSRKGEKIFFEHNLQDCENILENNEELSENNENEDVEKIERNKDSELENIDNNEQVSDFLYPISISFGDENDNNKIDFLQLEYIENLTGSLDFSKIFLSSKKDGLYFEKIENLSVLSGVIEENFVKIFIKESDFDFKNPKINNGEDSDFKIFTSGDFVLFSESSKKIFLFPDEKNWEHFEVIDFFENNILSKSDDIEIIPIIQNGSDVVFENGIFYCSRQNCRINLDFSEQFSSKNYFCNIYFGENLIKSCNPSSQIVKKGDKIFIDFIEKSTKNKIEKSFDLDFSRIKSSSSNRSSSRNPIKYTTPPVIFVSPQGKYEKEFVWNENEIECFYSTCAIDLTASGSFSYENANLKYFWNFGPNIEKTGKNPSSVVFEAGEYDILLTVSDNFGSYSLHEIKVKVPSDKPKPDEKNKKDTKDLKEKNSNNSQKIFEYKEPELVLQGRTSITEDEDGFFVCQTKTGKCNINFVLQNAQKEMKYYWGWDNEVAFESKNPKVKELQEGDHTLIIQGFYEKNLDEILYEKILSIKVEKIIPEKKASKKSRVVNKKSKKKTKKTQKTQKLQNNENIEKENIEAELKTDENNYSDIVFSLAGMCLVTACFPFFRSINRKNNEDDKNF